MRPFLVALGLVEAVAIPVGMFMSLSWLASMIILGPPALAVGIISGKYVR